MSKLTRPEVLTRAADVIEPHVRGKFKVRERAEGAALDLDTYSLLRGGIAPTTPPAVQERVMDILHCRYDWIIAERIAEDLAAAGLLAEVAS